MSYTTEQLKDVFRREVGDDIIPFRWHDAHIYSFIDEAQKEFVRRTRILFDKTTSLLAAGIVVTADDPNVIIDPRVLEVRRAELVTDQRKLKIINFNELSVESQANDFGRPLLGFQELTTKGPPNLLILDEEINSARLAPIPTVSDTLNLHVVRLPLLTITSSAQALEIVDTSDQRALLYYMKHLAYSYDDEDVGSEEFAAKFEIKFEDYMGRKISELSKKRRRPGTVRYGGIDIGTTRDCW